MKIAFTILLLSLLVGCSYTVPRDPIEDMDDPEAKIHENLLTLLRDFGQKLDNGVPYRVALRSLGTWADSLGRIKVYIYVSAKDPLIFTLIEESGGRRVPEDELTQMNIVCYLFPETVRFFARIRSVTTIEHTDPRRDLPYPYP